MKRKRYKDEYPCPECGYRHEGLETVAEGAGDRDAEYLIARVLLPTVKCSECGKELCEQCDQFRCSECGNTYCEAHRQVFDGDSMCPGCLVEANLAREAENTEGK